KTTSKSVFVETCPDGINDASLNQLQIYPNPASNSITIDLKNNHRSLNADIFDASGKLVLSTNINGEQTKIDISTLPPGSYQLVIENTSHNFTVVR
ncbi:MAG: T9SS type A sorting domain-containing protein, partial [Bacteroidales bacterium]|nr:T9SS type A sorting domain-containing protein [Bacteroidales bacterium]